MMYMHKNVNINVRFQQHSGMWILRNPRPEVGGTATEFICMTDSARNASCDVRIRM